MPVPITMSTLGRNGQFGNQLFQYAFLKIYAKRYRLQVETPAWIGQYLFGHSDPPISRPLPEVRDLAFQFPEPHSPLDNVDFWGYFQYHTSFYAPDREYFRLLFQPVPEIKARMEQAVKALRSRGKTLVGLHLRRGDYVVYQHTNPVFFVAPSAWYLDWLRTIWPTLDSPVLFLASDELDRVRGDFRQYHPVTSRELGVSLPLADFYPDFYLLSKCDIVAISNSSFSFSACMLNETGRLFMRPERNLQTLIPFDPWNSPVLL